MKIEPKIYLVGMSVCFLAICALCLWLFREVTMLKHNLADLFVIKAEQTVILADLLSNGKTESAQEFINNTMLTDYRIIERDLSNHPGKTYWLWLLADASKRRKANIPQDLQESFARQPALKPTPERVMFEDQWIIIGEK